MVFPSIVYQCVPLTSSVLEEHDVNFDKLKEAKKNIEQINSSLEQINQELKDLDSILSDYDEHDKKVLQLKVDDIKIKYKDLVQFQKEIREAEGLIKESSITCEILVKTIHEQDQEINEMLLICSMFFFASFNLSKLTSCSSKTDSLINLKSSWTG